MQESPQDTEVEEVLAAIRRLIVQGPPRSTTPAAPPRLAPFVLTPALRVGIAGPAAVPLLRRAEPAAPESPKPFDRTDAPTVEPLPADATSPALAESTEDPAPPPFDAADLAAEPPAPPVEAAVQPAPLAEDGPAGPEPSPVADPLAQAPRPAVAEAPPDDIAALPFEDEPDSEFVFRTGAPARPATPAPPRPDPTLRPDLPGPGASLLPQASAVPGAGPARPFADPLPGKAASPARPSGSSALTPLQPLDPNAPWIVDPFGLGLGAGLPPYAAPLAVAGDLGAPAQSEPPQPEEARRDPEPAEEPAPAAYPSEEAAEPPPAAASLAEEPAPAAPLSEVAEAEEAPPSIPTGAIWPEPDATEFPTLADPPSAEPELLAAPPEPLAAPETPSEPEAHSVAAQAPAEPSDGHLAGAEDQPAPGPFLADALSEAPPPGPPTPADAVPAPSEEPPGPLPEAAAAPLHAPPEPFAMTLVPPVEPLPPREEPQASAPAEPEPEAEQPSGWVSPAPWQDPALAAEPNWPELRPFRASAPVLEADAAVFGGILAATAEPAPLGGPAQASASGSAIPDEAGAAMAAPPLDPDLRALVADLVRQEVRRELASLREEVRRELMAELRSGS